MASKVIILTSQEVDSIDLNLIKIVEYFGIECEVLHFKNSELDYNKIYNHFEQNDACLMVNCKIMQFILENKFFVNMWTFILSKSRHIFFYNLYPADFINAAVNYLTNGLIKHLSQFEKNNHQYRINNENVKICRQFSGLSFGPINKDYDFIFKTDDGFNRIKNLISIDGNPYFVKINENEKELFLVANNRITDIDEKVGENFDTIHYFSQIVPVIMYLKYVFGDMCWHNDKHQASFIIDDPLLRKNYGFLNYKELLSIMDKQKFCTNIAFIPYNYKRIDPSIISLFNEKPSKYSISYHGCSHTDKEFGITDKKELNSKVRLAIFRMNELRKYTDLKCDKVMVFPQGIFSKDAMRILKANNFLAAVNSKALPYGSSCGLKVSEFLEPAIMKYEKFPLFLRRYPDKIVDFAFDIFLGKPLLIVEHHRFFKDGYDKLIDFVIKINSLEKDIQWDGLGNIIKNTYFKRKNNNGSIQIKTYANRTLIRNMSRTINKYNITNYEDGKVPIDKVVFDGKKIVDLEKSDKLIHFSVEIDPGASKFFEILFKNNLGFKYEKEKGVTKCKVVFRRFLSEARDNYISKSDLLLSMADLAKKGVNKILR